MQFNFKAYSELFPREEPTKPVIDTPVETFRPTVKDTKPVEVEPVADTPDESIENEPGEEG